MATKRALDIRIRGLRRRVRLLLIERYGLFGATAGLLAALPLILLSSKYEALLDRRLWAGAIAAGIIIGCLMGGLCRIRDLSVAISADKRSGLKERLSTAVALQTRPALGEMENALIDDAVEHIQSRKPSEVFRHGFGRPHVACGVAAILFLGAIVLPHIPALQSKNRQLEVAVMKKEGAKLEKMAKDMEKAAGPKRESLRKLAGRLDQLGKRMQSGRMEKKSAMLQAQRLSKQVQEEQDRLAKENSASKSMEQAQADMRKASEELAKHMAEKLAIDKKLPMAEAIKRVPMDKRMAELAKKAGALSPSELKELEKAVSRYADPKNIVPIPPELGEALAKLAQNQDYQKAVELMQKLAQKLNLPDSKMSPMDREALKKQLEMLARALKDTDLDQLAKMLRENAEKLARMSPEELEKLIKELQEMRDLAALLAKAGEG